VTGVFEEVHNYFAPSISSDAEMLFVVGLMADLFPYFIGNEVVWRRRSVSYRVAYRALAPTGIDPGIFAGRGAYGEYFRGQAAVVDGY